MTTITRLPLDHWLIAAPRIFASLGGWATLSPSGLLPLRMEAGLVRNVAAADLFEECQAIVAGRADVTVHVVLDRFDPERYPRVLELQRLQLDVQIHDWLESPAAVACALGTADVSLLRKNRPPAAVAHESDWVRRYAAALTRWAEAVHEEFGDEAVDPDWPTSASGWMSALVNSGDEVRVLAPTQEAANAAVARRVANFQDGKQNVWQIGRFADASAQLDVTVTVPQVAGAAVRVRLVCPAGSPRPEKVAFRPDKSWPWLRLEPLRWVGPDAGGLHEALILLSDDAGTLGAAVNARRKGGNLPEVSLPD